MADTVKKVDYFSMKVPNRRGEAAKALEALATSNVNLLAFTGFPVGGGRSQIDFVPANTAGFRRAAKKAGLKPSTRKTGFVVSGQRPAGRNRPSPKEDRCHRREYYRHRRRLCRQGPLWCDLLG